MEKYSTFVKANPTHLKQTISGALAIVSVGNVATSARSLVAAAGLLLTKLGIGALMGWMGLLWSQKGFALR
ncbi:hypothetical protein QUA07_17015 [Microcoleus sp. T3_A4]|uniref:hypothetical protein n=1 Tax=Microcoleus sp. T3_A4 TaxID=2818968 RepID=UPI002FD4C065